MTSGRLVAQGTRLALGEYEFSTAEPIALRIAGKWLRGSAEYSHRDFSGYIGWVLVSNEDGWCPIVTGMIARRG